MIHQLIQLKLVCLASLVKRNPVYSGVGAISLLYSIYLYIQFNKLRSMIQSSQNCGYLSSIYRGIHMILKSRLINFQQSVWGSKTVGKISYVDYIHNSTWYRVAIPIRKGPKFQILYSRGVAGNTTTDITHTLQLLAGPNRDFHSVRLTPQNLGFEYISIKTDDGRELEFNREDVLCLS